MINHPPAQQSRGSKECVSIDYEANLYVRLIFYWIMYWLLICACWLAAYFSFLLLSFHFISFRCISSSFISFHRHIIRLASTMCASTRYVNLPHPRTPTPPRDVISCFPVARGGIHAMLQIPPTPTTGVGSKEC